EDFGGLLQRNRVRAEKQIVIDVKHAGDRGPETGHHEGDPADEPDIVAEHAHAAGLVARTLQARSERRAPEAPDEEQRHEENHQGEIVEARCVADIEAERHWPRRMADAIVAPSEIVGAISHAPDDLPERK